MHMPTLARTVRHWIKICKSIQTSKRKLTIFRVRGKKVFPNRIYRGYYTDRVIYKVKKLTHRLLFTTLSIAVVIVEPTEKQKSAFIRKLRAIHAQCLTNPSNIKPIGNEFEKCKACKDHLKSYLHPMNEDIEEGCHLRDDVVQYIARYCGMDEMTTVQFLLSVGREQDLVHEICLWMSPCTLSDQTKANPTEKQKQEFNHKLNAVTHFEACVHCKKKFGQRLNRSGPKPFILNQSVRKETKQFTNVDEDWLWGKETKREYIERVCGIMGSCDD